MTRTYPVLPNPHTKSTRQTMPPGSVNHPVNHPISHEQAFAYVNGKEGAGIVHHG